MSTARATLGAGLLLLAATATAVPVAAWSPITGSRPTWCQRAPYYMNSAGSADLGASTSEAEVQRGMNDWTRVSCTGLTNSYQGTTGARPGSYEGTPTIGWTESGWRNDPNAIGVTGPQWNGRNCIIEADMELNGVNYTWTTSSGRGSNVNAYSIILHEGGHFYGLGHSTDRGATMYFAYSGGISSLNGDDNAGICALYPGDGPTDCTVTGCPAGEECVSGSCRAIVGDGTVCSPCTSNSECGGPGDYCIGYPDGGGYCGRACSSDSSCDAGDVCAPLSGGGRNCARINSSGRPDCSSTPMTGCRSDSECAATERCDTTSGDCVPLPTGGGSLGDPCASADECNSGVCFAGTCSRSCDWLDTSSCPLGYYCSGTATGSCGDALCIRGEAGSSADGEACTTATDCASRYCDGICTIPCIPGVGDTCPEGQVCRTGTLPGCGSCNVAANLGEACEINEDCATRRCARDGDRTFCTDFCGDAMPCPAGFTCTAAGDAMVCAPPPGRGSSRDDGGCCAVAPGAGGSKPLAPAMAGLLLLVAAWRRRR